MPTEQEIRQFHKKIESEIYNNRRDQSFKFKCKRKAEEGGFTYRKDDIPGVTIRVPINKNNTIRISVYADKKARESLRNSWVTVINECFHNYDDIFDIQNAKKNEGISSLCFKDEKDYNENNENEVIEWTKNEVNILLV